MVYDLYFDGGSRGNPGLAGWGVVIFSNKKYIYKSYGYIENSTNNFAEYKGLINGIKALKNVKDIDTLNIFGDSKLVISQINDVWKVKNPNMIILYSDVKKLLKDINWTAKWIPREKNNIADELANIAMDKKKSNEIKNFNISNFEKKIEDNAREKIKNSNIKDISLDNIDNIKNPHFRSQAIGSGLAPSNKKLKKTTIFYVRHGETDQTAKLTLSGSSTLGPNLLKIGRREAYKTGKLIKNIIESPVWPDIKTPVKIVSSPMLRTIDTAKEIQKHFKNINIEIDENFKEFNFGDYDGKSIELMEKENPDYLLKWSLGSTEIKTPNGDTYFDLNNRVQKGIQTIIKKYEGKSVIVTAHGGSIRTAVGVSLGLDTIEVMRIRVMPASLTVINYWTDKNGKVVLGIQPNNKSQSQNDKNNNSENNKAYLLPELLTQNMFSI